MREQEGASMKHQIVTLDLEYAMFGHGRNAWYDNSIAGEPSYILTSNIQLARADSLQQLN